MSLVFLRFQPTQVFLNSTFKLVYVYVPLYVKKMPSKQLFIVATRSFAHFALGGQVRFSILLCILHKIKFTLKSTADRSNLKHRTGLI
jgi:hypothetical protein